MRKLGHLLIVVAALALGSTALAGVAPDDGFCDVCTCANGEVLCLASPDEILEDQGVCGGACSGIGSSHGSRQLIEAPCGVLPQCGNVGAPAASPLWLSAAALALLAFGAFGLRRARARAAA